MPPYQITHRLPTIVPSSTSLPRRPAVIAFVKASPQNQAGYFGQVNASKAVGRLDTFCSITLTLRRKPVHTGLEFVIVHGLINAPMHPKYHGRKSSSWHTTPIRIPVNTVPIGGF